jgi:hypothetical protein
MMKNEDFLCFCCHKFISENEVEGNDQNDDEEKFLFDFDFLSSILKKKRRRKDIKKH